MNLNQVHLVAHSYGANLAFLMAIQHPEVVKTLTLISGNGPAAIPAPPDRRHADAGGVPSAPVLDGMELHPVQQRVVVDRARVRGAAPQRFPVQFPGVPHVGVGDVGERYQFDGVDLDLA